MVGRQATRFFLCFMWEKSKLYIPSNHRTFVKHLYKVDPTSATLAQHCINVLQMFCVWWGVSAGGKNIKEK